MREILFRGKRVDGGMWVEGSLIQTLVEESRENNVVNLRPACFIRFFDGSLCYEVEEDTVGQYTGLTDRNGKKVFEGDIVRYPVYQGSYSGEDIHQVVFERRGGSAYFGITMDDIETWYFCMSVPTDLMEVIGNIHDNPELIGGEKQ